MYSLKAFHKFVADTILWSHTTLTIMLIIGIKSVLDKDVVYVSYSEHHTF